MPTRPGWGVIIAGVAAFISGRVFGLVELYVIGTALLVAAVSALLVVHLRRANLEVRRWVHPSVLTVGTPGRVDLIVSQQRGRRSPRVAVADPVGDHNTAYMVIGPLRRNEQIVSGYRLPATKRGVLVLGPATIERRDLLGLASTRSLVAPPAEVTIAPRALELSIPTLGHGPLGRHLLSLSQRLGPGEFHSLREYVIGDEPRSIHWKASARSLNLKVRNHESQGVQRCTVVLDNEHLAYSPFDTDSFERAVVAASSFVVSAARAGLSTRLVTGGVDLRGPEVATTALQMLARVQLSGPIGPIDRDPGEGLGLQIVVTASPDAPIWRERSSTVDPAMTRIGVFSGRGGSGPMSVDASSLVSFRQEWDRLAGSRPATAATSTFSASTVPLVEPGITVS